MSANKMLEGMANTLHSFWVRKICEQKPWLEGKDGGLVPEDIEGMKAALLWLADNVSDEMVFAAIAPDVPNMEVFKKAFAPTISVRRKEIAAAIRAASEGV